MPLARPGHLWYYFHIMGFCRTARHAEKAPCAAQAKRRSTVQGIYFHIPYCLSKCRYCDFYSLGGSAAVPQEYVDALLRELARLRWQLPGAPDTLYFGGARPRLRG